MPRNAMILPRSLSRQRTTHYEVFRPDPISPRQSSDTWPELRPGIFAMRLQNPVM